jgi:hypothetical protein
MIALIASLVGPKLAKPVFYGVLALLVAAILSVGYCSLKRGAAEQAEQTTKSSEALADSAEQAVAVVINSNEREASVDAVVAQAEKEIDNAPDPVARRAAALRAVCGLPEYSRDPACAVQ